MEALQGGTNSVTPDGIPGMSHDLINQDLCFHCNVSEGLGYPHIAHAGSHAFVIFWKGNQLNWWTLQAVMVILRTHIIQHLTYNSISGVKSVGDICIILYHINTQFNSISVCYVLCLVIKLNHGMPHEPGTFIWLWIQILNQNVQDCKISYFNPEICSSSFISLNTNTYSFQ